MFSTETPKSMRIVTITGIARGIKTQVLRAAGLVDPLKLVSVISPERTLDLEFSSVGDTDMFYRSMLVVIENQRILNVRTDL